ncbi:MAG: NAD-dependent dehydratase [Rhodospirillaceae bacterium TMED167]|nr:NAD-dependent dehydratase [Rhodospirillaceae bacterium]OUW30038.1 MAG: NAD-dependent dehydratase [Rhodospirillaceae bacterium TMED167]
MNALVTGGAGFIGSHLVERLLSDGHQVTVLDNCSTGRWSNLDGIKNREHIETHLVDISCDPLDPHFEGIDWVFHTAGLADIVPSIQKPDAYFQANVVGTQRVVEAARKQDIKRLVYVASSTCYGIPEVYPTPETAPVQPQYPYALTKHLGEEIVMHWSQVYGLPSICLRLFNVYGPRSRTSGTYGAVFGVFLAQKLAGRPFTVVGDGTQTRDFTYVGDIADALVCAAGSDVSGEIFNVGSDNTYSINRLVALLDGEVEYIPKRPGEPDCTHADITKIKKILNWHPQTHLEDGVRIMLKNIDYWRKAPVWNKDSIADATKDWFEYLS